MKFKKILAAIDLSPMTTTVFDQALKLAKQEEASLKLFHCLRWRGINQDALLLIGANVSHNVALDEELRQHRQERLQDETHQTRTLLEGWCQQAAKQGVFAEFDYNVGEPGPLICGAARSWGADLIVLGRRGLKGLPEAWLGSVSNHVVHHAPCSVLVVQGDALPSGYINVHEG